MCSENMKRALITGLTGQDGAYLAKLLLNKGYKVYGTFRRVSTPNFWRPLSLGIYSKIHLIPADLLDMGSLLEALKVSDPDEVYNMGASSYVASSFEEPVVAQEITGISVTKLLESIRQYNANIKFYQASTSEMYGDNKFKFQLIQNVRHFNRIKTTTAIQLASVTIFEIIKSKAAFSKSTYLQCSSFGPLMGWIRG